MSHDKEIKGSSSETSASVNNISVTNRQLNVRPFQIMINENSTGRNGYGTSKDSFATLGSQTQR
jgi:hypothetical protein